MNNDTLIAILTVLIITLILMILAWCYRKSSNENKWQCLPGINHPLRKNPQTGNVECMSKDGMNCEEKCPDTSPVCPDMPLACGCDSLRKWGATGYSDPNHWCNISDNYLREGYFW